MSNPQLITVSLEWAKKLEGSKYPQDKTCSHYYDQKGHLVFAAMSEDISNANRITFTLVPTVPLKGSAELPWIAAPTASELMRRLPDTSSNHSILIVQHFLEKWHVQYLDGNNIVFIYSDPSLANAAAAMWCYLAENKLLPQPQ